MPVCTEGSAKFQITYWRTVFLLILLLVAVVDSTSRLPLKNSQLLSTKVGTIPDLTWIPLKCSACSLFFLFFCSGDETISSSAHLTKLELGLIMRWTMVERYSSVCLIVINRDLSLKGMGDASQPLLSVSTTTTWYFLHHKYPFVFE